MPRADYYFKKIILLKKYFLIFLINTKRNIHYMKKRYLKSLKTDLKEINWTNLSYNLIYNLLEFAKKNPDIEFIFKSKKLFF